MEEIKGLEPLNAFYNVWLLSRELHYHCAIFPFWWRRRESNSRLTGASCMFSHYYYNPIKTLVDRKGFEPLTQECKSRIFPIKLTAHIKTLVEQERIELSTSGCKPDIFPLKLPSHFGAPERTWTSNLLITKQLLYHLSYLSVWIQR